MNYPPNRKTKPPEERFWNRVLKSDGCWNWTGALSSNGYGVFKRGARGELLFKAHRFSYELANGPIPERGIIMHSCDNKRCVNPSHLSVGNHSQNLTDAFARGRRKVSELNRNRISNLKKKLMESDVIKIHQMRSSGETLKSIGGQFGVHLSSIHSIISGKTWKFLHPKADTTPNAAD